MTKCGSDEKLKQVIELKEKLLQAKEKYEELKIMPLVKKSCDIAMETPSPKGKSTTSKNVPVKFNMEASGRKKVASTTSLDPTSMETQLLLMREKQLRSVLSSLLTCYVLFIVQ